MGNDSSTIQKDNNTIMLPAIAINQIIHLICSHTDAVQPVTSLQYGVQCLGWHGKIPLLSKQTTQDIVMSISGLLSASYHSPRRESPSNNYLAK